MSPKVEAFMAPPKAPIPPEASTTESKDQEPATTTEVQDHFIKIEGLDPKFKVEAFTQPKILDDGILTADEVDQNGDGYLDVKLFGKNRRQYLFWQDLLYEEGLISETHVPGEKSPILLASYMTIQEVDGKLKVLAYLTAAQLKRYNKQFGKNIKASDLTTVPANEVEKKHDAQFRKDDKLTLEEKLREENRPQRGSSKRPYYELDITDELDLPELTLKYINQLPKPKIGADCFGAAYFFSGLIRTPTVFNQYIPSMDLVEHPNVTKVADEKPGDIVYLWSKEGGSEDRIHAYIDLGMGWALTKNGGGDKRPYRLQRIEQVKAIYAELAQYEPESGGEIKKQYSTIHETRYRVTGLKESNAHYDRAMKFLDEGEGSIKAAFFAYGDSLRENPLAIDDRFLDWAKEDKSLLLILRDILMEATFQEGHREALFEQLRKVLFLLETLTRKLYHSNDKAIEYYEELLQAIEDNKDNYPSETYQKYKRGILETIAELYAEDNNLEKAVEYCQRSIDTSLTPVPVSWIMLGKYYVEMGELNKAKHLFLKAKEYEGKLPWFPRKDLGLNLFKLGLTEEADPMIQDLEFKLCEYKNVKELRELFNNGEVPERQCLATQEVQDEFASHAPYIWHGLSVEGKTNFLNWQAQSSDWVSEVNGRSVDWLPMSSELLLKIFEEEPREIQEMTVVKMRQTGLRWDHKTEDALIDHFLSFLGSPKTAVQDAAFDQLVVLIFYDANKLPSEKRADLINFAKQKLNSQDKSIRENAEGLLEKSLTEEEIIELTDSNNVVLRRFGVSCLINEKIDEKVADTELKQALRDPSPEVRKEAAKALAIRGDKKDIKDLRRLKAREVFTRGWRKRGVSSDADQAIDKIKEKNPRLRRSRPSENEFME